MIRATPSASWSSLEVFDERDLRRCDAYPGERLRVSHPHCTPGRFRGQLSIVDYTEGPGKSSAQDGQAELDITEQASHAESLDGLRAHQPSVSSMVRAYKRRQSSAPSGVEDRRPEGATHLSPCRPPGARTRARMASGTCAPGSSHAVRRRGPGRGTAPFGRGRRKSHRQVKLMRRLARDTCAVDDLATLAQVVPHSLVTRPTALQREVFSLDWKVPSD